MNPGSARHGLPALERIRLRLAEGPRGEGEFNGDGRDLARSRPPKPAAVLVPLVVRGEAPSVLLTRRTDHLHHHPGEISFPGGRLEDDDPSPVHAALRETEEEIGLARRHVELIGALPDYFTGTGFRVTPVVGVVHPPLELTLDAFEVAEAFEVPLAHFLDPRNHQEHSILHEGRMRRFHAMPWHGYFIWGATAGILMSLYRMLQDEA